MCIMRPVTTTEPQMQTPDKARTRAHYESLAAEAVGNVPNALALAHYAAVQDMENSAANAELVDRVNAEADAATALPWWFWEAAIVVFFVTLLISALWPWGFA